MRRLLLVALLINASVLPLPVRAEEEEGTRRIPLSDGTSLRHWQKAPGQGWLIEDKILHQKSAIGFVAFTQADDRWGKTMRMSPLFTLGLYGFMLSWILVWAFVLYRRAKHPRQELMHLEILSRPDAETTAPASREDGDWWKPSD